MVVELVQINKSDIGLIDRWLTVEHVRRRWGVLTYRELEKCACLGRALIACDGQPAGYIQWQHPTRNELDTAGLYNITIDIVDIDIFIGETTLLRRGIGHLAIRCLIETLVSQSRNQSSFMACVAIDNIASIRMFEKFGFIKERTFDDAPDGGLHTLLIYRSLSKYIHK
jgi:RimJ/RimL family protein N-acetyltransferase